MDNPIDKATILENNWSTTAKANTEFRTNKSTLTATTPSISQTDEEGSFHDTSTTGDSEKFLAKIENGEVSMQYSSTSIRKKQRLSIKERNQKSSIAPSTALDSSSSEYDDYISDSQAKYRSRRKYAWKRMKSFQKDGTSETTPNRQKRLSSMETEVFSVIKNNSVEEIGQSEVTSLQFNTKKTENSPSTKMIYLEKWLNEAAACSSKDSFSEESCKIGYCRPAAKSSRSSSSWKLGSTQKLQEHILKKTKSPPSSPKYSVSRRFKRRGVRTDSFASKTSINPSKIYNGLISTWRRSCVQVSSPSQLDSLCGNSRDLKSIAEEEVVKEDFGKGDMSISSITKMENSDKSGCPCPEVSFINQSVQDLSIKLPEENSIPANQSSEETSESEGEEELSYEEIMRRLQEEIDNSDIPSRLVRDASKLKMCSKNDLHRYLLIDSGHDMTKEETDFFHQKVTDFCVEFTNKLCANAKLPGGVFTYQELRKALLEEDLIQDKNSEPYMQISQFFTRQQMDEIRGVLIPEKDSEVWDTYLHWQKKEVAPEENEENSANGENSSGKPTSSGGGALKQK